MTDIITQLSIFVKNEPGSFASITSTLKECNINLKAFNIAESSGFGVLRAIANNPKEAYDTLKDKNIIVKLTDVIAVKLNDAPGGIYDVAKVFGDNNLNIEYAYAYAGVNGPAVFFRVDEPGVAIKVLKDAGLEILSEEDL
ncbi:MAG: amino acid-binding protein [Candidatus Methanomethylophilaceae archaeon]|nr:amino acid-binding protein [Candidatus Methanomethylophilaceae archaeon]